MTDSCVHHSNQSHHERIEFFLFKLSVNTCRTRLKETFSRFTRAKVEYDLRDDPISLNQLDDILNPSMSKGMMELPRIDPENRLPNDNFQILTWRKLRVKLFPREGVKLCSCGAIVDKYWDHTFSCRYHSKTPCHHSIRDCLYTQFKELLPQCHLANSPSMILREPPNLIDGLPNLRPFDVSFIPGHSASDKVWKTPLSHIGFDVTVISPALEPRRLPPSLAARTKYILRLREGERLKFQRDAATDADTRITRSGDDIIRDINTKNMALIPIPILPGGSTHGLF